MENPFKKAEETYSLLKERFRQGEITRGDFLDEMKNLQVRDDQGRLWMIGNQSGKWYVLKGKEWVQSEPPAQKKDARAVCPYCGLENKPEAEVCARCGGNVRIEADVCPRCKSKLQAPLYRCPICDVPEAHATGEVPRRETGRMAAPVSEPPAVRAAASSLHERKDRRPTVARSVGAPSFAFFGGALGIVAGIVLGAFVGSTRLLSHVAAALPAFLADMQGTLVGAVVYAAALGLAGFLALGLVFFLLAVFINLILSFVGGVKIYLDGPK